MGNSYKIKFRKTILAVTLEELKNEIFNNNFEILPLDFEHFIQLSSLENAHKDPFDRIIIAQAIVENLEIISKDTNFKRYKKTKVSW
ncbi:type II toxin-antitoxin system VapC family toxin [Pedobacter alpinus]|uniref:Type II toxin-antitoxin system VapC family toxin n=1 Tax=Pedobacter alpinus TaxID=1590643 RepID=A0ABW5TPI9_9SPHI